MNSNLRLINEFKPALRFLAIFVGIYIAGNTLYGLWIESWKPSPDPMTSVATHQTSLVLQWWGEPTSYTPNQDRPTINLTRDERTVLRVFEGCNGINVMIVFVAFLFAFKGEWKRLVVFGLAGLFAIHLANLTRLVLLYFVAVYRPSYFYYFHKYFFTAALYLVVFLLWYLWMRLAGINKNVVASVEK